MQKHIALNRTTGEVLATNKANRLKRWVAQRTAENISFFDRLEPHRWVFAHGKNFDDCVAKLTARGVWG